MKTIFTSALLLCAFAGFAQTPAKAGSTGTATTTTTTQTTPVLSAKAKSLCKEWSLSKTENFGDLRNPDENQKGDRFILMENGRYRLIYNGVAEGGTWTIDKANTLITLTKDDGTVKKFKILESTDSSLKIDYRDADDIHNILIYAPGTTGSSSSSGSRQ